MESKLLETGSRFIDTGSRLINTDIIGWMSVREQSWCVDGAIEKRHIIVFGDKYGKEMYTEDFMTREERDIIYEDIKRKVMGM